MSNPVYGQPCVYRGIKFRSRTEGLWACFIGKLMWDWEYEPPLDLNRYITDFALRFHKPLLLEVKGDAATLTDLERHKAKLERSGWAGEAVLTCATPLELESMSPVIGLIGERILIDRELVWQWSTARGFVCSSCGHLSVLAEDGDWRCRVCGVGDGNAHVLPVQDRISREWNLAKNQLQWRPGT